MCAKSTVDMLAHTGAKYAYAQSKGRWVNMGDHRVYIEGDLDRSRKKVRLGTFSSCPFNWFTVVFCKFLSSLCTSSLFLSSTPYNFEYYAFISSFLLPDYYFINFNDLVDFCSSFLYFTFPPFHLFFFSFSFSLSS